MLHHGASNTPRLPPQAVEFDGDFTHRMLHTRGIRLHAVTAGDPHDPLIVLLHGTFSGWFDFIDVITPLAERGFYVAALDMRGYGMSDKPLPRSGNSMRIAIGDIKGAISTLGHKEAMLAGADTGGAVAWSLAASEPQMVRGLVSISAAHPADLRRGVRKRPWDYPQLLRRTVLFRLPPRVLSTLVNRRRMVSEDLRLNTSAAFQDSRRYARVLERRHAAAAIENTFIHSVHNSRLLMLSMTSRKDSTRVSCPTLLVYPSEPPWQYLSALQVDRVTAPLKHVHIPGAKNLPQVENPEAIVAAISEFCHNL